MRSGPAGSTDPQRDRHDRDRSRDVGRRPRTTLRCSCGKRLAVYTDHPEGAHVTGEDRKVAADGRELDDTRGDLQDAVHNRFTVWRVRCPRCRKLDRPVRHATLSAAVARARDTGRREVTAGVDF